MLYSKRARATLTAFCTTTLFVLMSVWIFSAVTIAPETHITQRKKLGEIRYGRLVLGADKLPVELQIVNDQELVIRTASQWRRVGLIDNVAELDEPVELQAENGKTHYRIAKIVFVPRYVYTEYYALLIVDVGGDTSFRMDCYVALSDDPDEVGTAHCDGLMSIRAETEFLYFLRGISFARLPQRTWFDQFGKEDVRISIGTMDHETKSCSMVYSHTDDLQPAFGFHLPQGNLTFQSADGSTGNYGIDFTDFC